MKEDWLWVIPLSTHLVAVIGVGPVTNLSGKGRLVAVICTVAEVDAVVLGLYGRNRP